MEAEDDGQHGSRTGSRRSRSVRTALRGAGSAARPPAAPARRDTRRRPCLRRPFRASVATRPPAPRARRRARRPPHARARSRTRSAARCSPGSAALAVALGVIFLLAIAVSRGWLGEVERTLLAGIASSAACWPRAPGLHGRRGAPDAAKAAVAAGIVGLFATCVVATAVYDARARAARRSPARSPSARSPRALAVRWARARHRRARRRSARSRRRCWSAPSARTRPSLLLLVATASATGRAAVAALDLAGVRARSRSPRRSGSRTSVDRRAAAPPSRSPCSSRSAR